MIFGLHAAMMKYGTTEDNPAPEIATITYLFVAISMVVAIISWFGRGYFSAWQGISDYKMLWAILTGFLVASYNIFMSIPQTLHKFELRGIMEILMAFLLLPGMLIGHWLVGRQYENQLITQAIAYAIPVVFLLYRFRHMLAPRWLLSPQTGLILKYGLITAISNFAFVIVIVVQPLQLAPHLGSYGVGVHTVYSIGSLNLATLATGIFFSVFFPKISNNSNKRLIWEMLNKTWLRAIVPTFLFYCIMTTLVLYLSGKHQYPLHFTWVVWFSLAATLISVHASYSQIISAQGIRGVIWVLVIAYITAGINYSLTEYLVPKFGLPASAITLSINYAITLIMTQVAGYKLILSPSKAAVQSPPSHP